MCQDGIDLCLMSVVNESLIKSVSQESAPDSAHLHVDEQHKITTQPT